MAQLSCTLIVLMAFFGWGILASRVIPGLKDLTRIEEFVPLGICTTMALLQLYHCVFPITHQLLIGWIIVGFGIVARNRRVFALSMSRLQAIRSWLWVPATFVILRNAVDAVCYVPQSDSYHFLSLNWFHSHPLVPGLANLDGRFGFNCASFLVHAMFTVDPIAELGCGVLHNSIVVTMIVAGFPSLIHFINAQYTTLDLASGTILVWPVLFLIGAWRTSLSTSGISPDGTVFLLQQLLVLLWLRAAHGHLTGRTGGRCKAISILAVFVAVTLVIVKLSAAVFSMSMVFVLCLLMWLNPRYSVRTATIRSVIGVCIALGVLAPWIFRGIMQSGFAAYPSSIGAADVEWRVSEPMRQEELLMIGDWARYGRMSQSTDEPWLKNWLIGNFPNPWSGSRTSGGQPSGMIYLIFWLLAVSYGISRSSDHGCRRTAYLWKLLVFIGLLASICWFLTAPHPRFFLGVCYAILGGVTALLLAKQKRTHRKQIAWLSVSVLLMFAIYDRTMNEVSRGYGAARVAMNSLAFFPPNSAGHFRFESQNGNPHKTENGLNIYVPVIGFRAPLLSVETLYSGWERLELRSPGDLSAGFRKRSSNVSVNQESQKTIQGP